MRVGGTPIRCPTSQATCYLLRGSARDVVCCIGHVRTSYELGLLQGKRLTGVSGSRAYGKYFSELRFPCKGLLGQPYYGRQARVNHPVVISHTAAYA